MQLIGYYDGISKQEIAVLMDNQSSSDVSSRLACRKLDLGSRTYFGPIIVSGRTIAS